MYAVLIMRGSIASFQLLLTDMRFRVMFAKVVHNVFYAFFLVYLPYIY
jgi:hypothetical protein